MSKSDLIISKPEKRTKEQLTRLQNLPLQQKINLSLRRIEQFYIQNKGNVYKSNSMGKDSTVMSHLVYGLYPDVPDVFCNTGNEFPENVDLTKEYENLIVIRPKLSIGQVLNKHGFPVVSKKVSMAISRYRTGSEQQKELRAVGGINPSSGKLQSRTIPIWCQPLINAPFKISERCCDVLKKEPFKRFERETGLKPYIGLMAEESKLREDEWVGRGCNSFDGHIQSNPLMFWRERDIWQYILTNNLKFSKAYDNGERRTGCMFCMFGCQFDDYGGRPRFDRMKKNYPKHWNAFVKMGCKEPLDFIDLMLGRDQGEFDFDE